MSNLTSKTEPTRLLVVEDEFEIRLASTLQLRARGYEVDAVENGLECLSAVASKQYDVVLMDIRMPKMDGLTAIAKLQANPDTADLPIVVVSASPGDQSHALESGAKFFVRKPFSSEILTDAIESARHQRSKDERSLSTVAL